MNTHQHQPLKRMTVVAAAVALIAVAQVTANAAQDPGEPRQTRATETANNCFLTRVEQQFLRCDNLTGAGVPAPLWIPER